MEALPVPRGELAVRFLGNHPLGLFDQGPYGERGQRLAKNVRRTLDEPAMGRLEAARSFYARYGFKALLDEALHVSLPTRALAGLFD